MLLLQGTLEAAVLTEIYGGNAARGTIPRTGDQVYVSNGRQALEIGIREVLVRTDTNNNLVNGFVPTGQTGNFVSSDVRAIKGHRHGNVPAYLDAPAYFLTGVWPWKGYWPGIAEVNEEFNPGKMGKAAYFPDGENGRWIHVNGAESSITDYQDAIERHLAVDPRKYARVILVGEEAQIPGLESVLKDRGFAMVRMEALSDVGKLQRDAAAQARSSPMHHVMGWVRR